MAKLIHYDKTARATLDACIAYLDAATVYLKDPSANLPDIRPLLGARFPNSTITVPAKRFSEVRGLRWPTVSAFIDNSIIDHRRHFDPWYFAVMLLLELPGGRIVAMGSNHQDYVYLGYAGTNKNRNIKLRRIIANTPAWADTLDENSHFDLRRPSLSFVSKDVRKILGFKTKGLSSGRAKAVELAGQLFDEQLSLQIADQSGEAEMPGLELTVSGYTNLLEIALQLADLMHERYSLRRGFANS